MSAMKIEKNSNVQFHYTISDTSGNFLSSSDEDGVASYICGYNLILPKLEEALVGHEKGEAFDVPISKNDAFGDRNDELIFEVDANIFHSDSPLEVGQEFTDDYSGNTVRVIELRGEKILVDANHPFAGKDLVFSVKIEDVSKATDEQISELMRALNSHSCGCGCGDHEHDFGCDSCGGGCC